MLYIEKNASGLSYHCGYTRENFSLIAHSQMKLCLFKVAKSDVCIYKTPFRKSSHIYCLHPTITPAIDDYLCSFPLCPNFLQIIESLTTGSVTFLIHYVRTWPTSLLNIATFLTAFDIAEACFAIIYIATSHTMHISTHHKHICLKKLYPIRTTTSKLLTSSLSKVRSCALQIIIMKHLTLSLLIPVRGQIKEIARLIS